MHFRLVRTFLRGVGDLKLCGRVRSTIRGFTVLAATIACFLASLQSALAQATNGKQESLPGVVLTKLFPPLYPPLARQARIVGDVKVQLSIRPDGSVGSAAPVSGDAVLVPAAMESARQSQFECRGCSETNIAYSMTYTFQVLGELDRCCCTAKTGASTDSAAGRYGVSQLQDHVTLTVGPVCVCPDACTEAWAQEHSKFRSVHAVSIE